MQIYIADTYDIITVVGSHGPNHIESEAIYEMIRLVKSGMHSLLEHHKEKHCQR